MWYDIEYKSMKKENIKSKKEVKIKDKKSIIKKVVKKPVLKNVIKTITKKSVIKKVVHKNKKDINIKDIKNKKKEEDFVVKDENVKNKNYKIVDLFAGIGGFHIAMNDFGGKCVFASEFNQDSQKVYFENHNILPKGDITLINEKDIPSHDILFAGFPCQPFSKGGQRKGFNDARGTLFFDIVRILKYHKPKYFLLENVANLVSHDNGNTYKVIIDTLDKLGYSVPKNSIILSPNQFGVPVLRKRIYIPGTLKENDNFENKFEFLLKEKTKTKDIYSILDSKFDKQKDLLITEYENKVLEMWDIFYKNIDIKIIGFPIWIDYFKSDINKNKDFPEWKKSIISKNIDLYKRNKTFIDKWIKENDNLKWVKDTHRKFEWQAGENIKSVFEGLIQFRPSGVRVKRPDYFSTLVAINHNQIIGKLKRRPHPEEIKMLQSLGKDFKLPANKNVSLKQLGNAVNVDVVKKILNVMFI